MHNYHIFAPTKTIKYILNFESFISRRFLKENKHKFSQSALRLSILSIALGLAIMILSISIVTGFQKNIRQILASFNGHIQITKYINNKSTELPAIYTNHETEEKILANNHIVSISPFALKSGIINANNIIQACVLKGINENYYWGYFDNWIIKGRKPNISTHKKVNEILISKHISNKLQLDIDSSFLMYFMQEPPRIRKFTIVGIYQSGFPDFDNHFVFGDIKHIQKLNDWEKNQIAGYEIMLDDFDQMLQQTDWVHNEVDYNLRASNLTEEHEDILNWLNLLDTNVYFILGLMILISGVGMIATLLILILEKTKFIGTMKAIGASNNSIRKIFIYHGIFISIRGLALGNIIGIGFSLLQKYFQLIPLDATNYYMNAVPININFISILALNIGVLFIITVLMWLPAIIISGITPVKALRFE